MRCLKESYKISAKFVDGGTNFCFELSRRTIITVYQSECTGVGKLRELRISDQSTINNLPKQLIGEKEVQVKKIQETVQMKLRQYRKK